MKKVLVVNAHEYYKKSPGEYNQTLVDTAINFLEKRGDEVQITTIQNGYEPEDEVAKMMWADVIVFQFPLYWMGIPAHFKKYLDLVLSVSQGTLYAHDGRKEGGSYGSGGMTKGKKYMFSVTMNAPKEAFNDPETFFEGADIDQLLFARHKAFQFVGLTPLKTFACYNVMMNPQIEKDIGLFERHLEKEIISSF